VAAGAVAAEGQLVAERLVAAAAARPLVAVAAVMVVAVATVAAAVPAVVVVVAVVSAAAHDDDRDQRKGFLHTALQLVHIRSASKRTLLASNQPFRSDTLTRTLFHDHYSEGTRSEDTRWEDTRSEDTRSEDTRWAGNSVLPGKIPLAVAKRRLGWGAAWASRTVSW
jgi:hypothetical protein